VSRTFFGNDPKLDKYLDVDFDLNLGITWVALEINRGQVSFNPSPNKVFPPLSPDGFQPVLFTSKSLVGITGYYNSSYDFRMVSLYSDPIVSKLQNPGLEVFFEGITLPSLLLTHDSVEGPLGPGYSTTPGKIVTHGAVGLAHESNGQFLETLADFQKIREISETLYNQSFASMGWNYGYLRWANEIPFFLKADQVLGMVEYRWFIPPFGIQDSTDLEGAGIKPAGIWAYDGLRLGLVFQNLVRSVTSTGTYIKAQLVLPSLFDRQARFLYTSLDIPMGLELSAITEFHTFPIYWGLAVGTCRDPAWFFKNTVTLKVGVSFPTVFYVNDLDSTS